MRVSIIVASCLVLAILAFCYKGLYINQHILASNLLGKPMPKTKLISLAGTSVNIDGLEKPYVMNVFASWCGSCKYEHGFWQDLDDKYKKHLFGLAYKDNSKKLQGWLGLYGNPYHKVLLDPKGLYSMQLGVYGTPETFVVDKDGIIKYRHVGIMDKRTWEVKIIPLISK